MRGRHLDVSSIQFSSVAQSCQLFATPRTRARQPFSSIINPQSLLKLMSIELVMPSTHLIHCHPLLFVPLIFPRIRVFFNELAFHIRWPKCWNFSFSISTSYGYSELISFRIYWWSGIPISLRIFHSLL